MLVVKAIGVGASIDQWNTIFARGNTYKKTWFISNWVYRLVKKKNWWAIKIIKYLVI